MDTYTHNPNPTRHHKPTRSRGSWKAFEQAWRSGRKLSCNTKTAVCNQTPSPTPQNDQIHSNKNKNNKNKNNKNIITNHTKKMGTSASREELYSIGAMEEQQQQQSSSSTSTTSSSSSRTSISSDLPSPPTPPSSSSSIIGNGATNNNNNSQQHQFNHNNNNNHDLLSPPLTSNTLSKTLSNKKDTTYRVVIFGESKVGKTSLNRRLVGKPYQKLERKTIGKNVFSCEVEFFQRPFQFKITVRTHTSFFPLSRLQKFENGIIFTVFSVLKLCPKFLKFFCAFDACENGLIV